mgnify:CR=1 FL=1
MRNPPRTVKGMQRLINNIDHTLQVRQANRKRGQAKPGFVDHRRKMKAVMKALSDEWKAEKRNSGARGIRAYRAFVQSRLRGQKGVW